MTTHLGFSRIQKLDFEKLVLLILGCTVNRVANAFAPRTVIIHLLWFHYYYYFFFTFSFFFNLSFHFCLSCLLPLLLHPFAASDRQHGDSLRQGLGQD